MTKLGDRFYRSADCRPRIHIWPTPQGAAYAFGPTAPKRSKMSAGEALEAALDEISHAAAVIIYEGPETRHGGQ